MEKEKKVTLDDIAGYPEEKREAENLIDVLGNYALYKAAGARLPRGLLLCGVPGVGKTMFAKAIATEANVPLYQFEAGESENTEQTISGIKAMFAQAKEHAPSILFIDELDELVTGTDGSGLYGFQSDYSRKMLKTLLTEIDGISSSDGVLLIATTNSKNTLPPALIRAGRMGKQITFRLPDFDDRTAIAKLYLDLIDAKGIDPKEVAKKTDGFSGADIKALVNAALLEAVRLKKEVDMASIVRLIPTIRFGEIKKTAKQGPADSVCYHEIGHFLAQYALNKRVGSISVENYGEIRGRMELDDEINIVPETTRFDVRSAKAVLDDVVVSLGGIAGEEVFLHERYCGSQSDLSKAFASIYMVLQNGALGFALMPCFDLVNQNMVSLARLSTSNRVHEESYQRKIIEIMEEKLALAI